MATRKRTNRKSRKQRRKRGGAGVSTYASQFKQYIKDGIVFANVIHKYTITDNTTIDSDIKTIAEKYNEKSGEEYKYMDLDMFVLYELLKKGSITIAPPSSVPEKTSAYPI